MSRKDPKKRKEREARKRQEKLAADKLAQERVKAQRQLPSILEQLNALFKDKAAKAIVMAFEQGLSPQEISKALDVPIEQVEYLFDIAGNANEELLRLVRRWPMAFENPEVLNAAIKAVQRGGYRELFRS
jgi:hypothetical protein